MNFFPQWELKKPTTTWIICKTPQVYGFTKREINELAGQDVRTTANEAENKMTAQIVLKMSESDFGSDANFSAFVNAGDSVLFVSEVQISKNESTKPSIVSMHFMALHFANLSRNCHKLVISS